MKTMLAKSRSLQGYVRENVLNHTRVSDTNHGARMSNPGCNHI